jgi:hypothetical protein
MAIGKQNIGFITELLMILVESAVHAVTYGGTNL